MASRSIRVEFLPVEHAYEVTSTPEVHDISIPDVTDGVPEVLENPHVDFPGTWTLVGEGEGGVYQYTRAARVADTSDTAAL